MLKHGEIVQAFYRVYNTLGHGFLESVYEKAMLVALRKAGLRVRPQAKIDVYYEGELVGEFFADLYVEECVIVELKAVQALLNEHHAQVINYLKATGVEVGLLMNFGPKPEVKRKICDKMDSTVEET